MDSIKTLERKVILVAERLTKATEENQKLQTELKYLEEENKRTKELISDNAKLSDERKTITNRIEKILKKFTSIKS
jgi:cell shape-determining protein MreC